MASEMKKESRFLDFFRRDSKIIIAVVLGFIILALGALGVIWAINNDFALGDPIIASFAGGKVHLSDYNERAYALTRSGSVDKPTKIDDSIKDSVLNDTINQKVLEKEVSDRGLSATDGQLTDKAKTLFADYDTVDTDMQRVLKDFSKLAVYQDILRDKVLTVSEGYYIACRYDRALQSDYDGKTAEAAALTEKQKAYAETYCNGVYDRLNSGKSGFDKELADIKADPILGDKSWDPWKMTLGRTITKEDNASNYLLGSTVMTTLNTPEFSQKGVYKPFVAKVQKDPHSSDQADGMFVVAGFTSDRKMGVTNDFDSWVANLVKSKNVKTYLNRIG